MSNNPYSYQPGQPNYPGYPGGYQAPPGFDPAGMIKGPALSLVIVQGISVACFVFSILFDLILLATGNSGIADRQTFDMPGSAVVTTRLTLAVPLLAVNVVTLIGAIQMLRWRSYGFAMTAAVLSVIPCLSGCYCVGIPFGIWSLVVLSKPEVKQAFR